MTNYKPAEILIRLDGSSSNESSHELQCRCFDAADEIRRLRAVIKKTLDENGHLADGDNCTLIDLKKAIGYV
jgi:hypothetical protein